MTSIPNAAHRKYPYLLKELEINRTDQVWCTDITYIPMERGYAYLVAIMDWNTRAVLSWKLSNTTNDWAKMTKFVCNSCTFRLSPRPIFESVFGV